MTAEKLVHAQTVEALFVRAFENRLTPACREALKRAGLDLDRKLERSYTLDQWRNFLRIAAAHVYGGVPAEAAYYSLGERFMDAWFGTFLGKALLGVARLAGPRRMLQRAGQGIRAGNNFSEVQVVERGPASLELYMNDVMADQPTFAAGLLARAVELTGGWRVVAIPEGFDGTASTFHIRWSEAPAAATLSEEATADGRAAAPRPRA
ncbi:TIGR02265 family protein [Hyalangium sp.]|uniref:TIGR02265 family protein n=1 Tax=Hyalangium sp. TaxID=2028555 RepID=UPI002D4D9946|nr:TIGR02265 family protein [Hyalangium sp.]HYH95851.1 TIGR02265 family protein [Hyalangium sp.]